jgi:hypothetical protein
MGPAAGPNTAANARTWITTAAAQSVRAQTKTRAAARDYAQRQTVLQAQPLLRQLAAQGRVNAAVDAAQPPAGATSPAVANVIRSYLGPKWARSIWNPSKR